MKRRLYEVKTYRDHVFERERAAKWYAQIERSRKPFALAVNAMLAGYEKGKGFAPPQAAQGLINQLRTWKKDYKTMHEIPMITTVKRVYHGRKIEIELSSLKPNRLKAIKQIHDRVREMRRQEKHIEWGSELHYNIGRREPNGLLKEYQSKRLRLPKRPKDGMDYIGIEIECIMQAGADFTPLYPFSKWIEISGDGSIEHKHNEEGTEFKVCVRRDEVREVLPKIMETLKTMGARVNKSCGLHVHLDQRNNEEPDKAFQRLVRSLGLLYTVVPESRRRNKYCKRNRHADFAAATRGERYKAINASAFSRHRTIEVRLFGGTLESTKIINWIEVLLAIAYGETVMRCPKTFDTAMRYWKFSEENLAWLKERQVKFSSINAGMPVSEHETEENQMLLDETQPDPEEETCGECENPLDDCSCNDMCDCGDCNDCEERQAEEERASVRRRNAEIDRRRREAEALERRRAEEAAQRNMIMPISLQSIDSSTLNWWHDAAVPIQPVMRFEDMQRAVDQLANQHIESMQQNMYNNVVFLNDGVWGVTAAEPEQPSVAPPVTPTEPNTNSEVQF